MLCFHKLINKTFECIHTVAQNGQVSKPVQSGFSILLIYKRQRELGMKRGREVEEEARKTKRKGESVSAGAGRQVWEPKL